MKYAGKFHVVASELAERARYQRTQKGMQRVSTLAKDFERLATEVQSQSTEFPSKESLGTLLARGLFILSFPK